MKALVVSDIHLGSPLVDKKVQLMNLLEYNEYDVIILNGDIFDIWEKSFKQILLDNIDFVKLLHKISAEKKLYFILGNHDPHQLEIEKMFPNMIVGKNLTIFDDILIVHGDEFDDLVTKYSWFAKLIFIPHWICQRVFNWNLKATFREFFYSISNKKNKQYFNKLVGDIEEAAVEKYKNECNYLIMGHTHTPKLVKREECTYINCGDIIHNDVCVEFDDDKKFKFIGV
jgi:UDP-2,3-diacylglucosamine pyrophosphatase LpxH